MSYRHTLEAALESIHEIGEMVKGFPGEGKIPSIEMDLVLQKLRNIYELMLMVKEDGEPANSKEPLVATGTKLPDIEELAVKKDGRVKSVMVQEPDKPVTAATDFEKKPKDVESTSPLKIKKTVSEKEAQTLADQFKGKATLHESLHKKLTTESRTLAHGTSISDLMTAIAINDRFTFIRELFNNDTAGFEKAVEQLNQAGTYNEAYNYMTSHYEWDMDSETVHLLLDIISRKLIKGGNE